MFPKFIQVGLYLGDVCIGGLAFRMLIGLPIWGAYKREHIYGTLRYLLMNRQLVFHEFVFNQFFFNFMFRLLMLYHKFTLN